MNKTQKNDSMTINQVVKMIEDVNILEPKPAERETLIKAFVTNFKKEYSIAPINKDEVCISCNTALSCAEAYHTSGYVNNKFCTHLHLCKNCAINKFKKKTFIKLKDN